MVLRPGSTVLLWGLVLLLVPAMLWTKEPDHRKLDWFVDGDGTIRHVATPADWAKRRASILTRMQAVMGPLPDRLHLPPLNIRVQETIVGNGYRRQTITLDNVYGEKVTAYLYIPDRNRAGRQGPAALALHPTNAGGKEDNDDGPPPHPNLGYASELARLGFVVIAPDYPSFGGQKGYDFKNSQYASGTMKAISDNMRCIDLLIAREDVDPGQIAAIGHSLGGHNALFTAAFDQRIAVTVTSCGWTPFHDYYGGKKLANWAQDRYMPQIRDVYQCDPDRVPFDFAEVIATIAPRAVFVSAPLRDSNFDVRGVQSAEPEIHSIFELLGAASRFVVRHPDGEHGFPLEMQREAYQFIQTVTSR
jgi:dienelactone hydrolase